MVEIDGKTLAELNYSLAGNDILIINHTEVDDSLLGKNVGYQLLQHSVDYAREKHFKIMPLCPFANAIFKKKAVAYGDLLKNKIMIVTIFGATGMVGKHLVKQALLKGHIVKAFGRNVFTAGFAENENLHLVQGALFDAAEVHDALTGSDAVFSALGGAFDGTDKTRSLGIKNIVAQMEKNTVKRIIAIGGMGVLDDEAGNKLLDSPEYPQQYLAVGQEHFKAYEFLKASTLDWTMVCPPDIMDAEVTGLYHTAANHVPTPNNYKINAGDLSLFMLNALEKNEYLHERVGISN